MGASSAFGKNGACMRAHQLARKTYISLHDIGAEEYV